MKVDKLIFLKKQPFKAEDWHNLVIFIFMVYQEIKGVT